MRAIVCPSYGPADLLQLVDVPTPVPGPKEVLVRTYATTVSTGDWRLRSGQFPDGFGWIAKLVVGMKGPRQPILGTELSGVVEAVGSAVTRFKKGDAVFAFGDVGLRCHAEFRCFAQDGLIVPKPPNLTFEEAAALSFGGTTALDMLRRAKVQPGEHVLVNGASGGVGSAAVQLAKALGAQVTGICSTGNMELVKSLGADRVIDYTQVDFTKESTRYDVIIDVAGTAPYARSRLALKDNGRLALVLASLGENLGALWVGLTTGHRVIAGPVGIGPEDMRQLAELAAQGKYTAVVEQRFPLERIADAHRVVDTGHKRGAVVVTLDARSSTR
jgi:NADPH:quinone reductase-like Zn-dependent oxidoreductase